jgi:hypothetical protein
MNGASDGLTFERKSEPLLGRWQFVARMLRALAAATLVVIVSLAMGVAGYHFLAGLTWIDALLNSAMILTGMGPVNPITSTGGKLFATFYALYSGLAFLTATAILLAPLIHRMLHKFHVTDDEDETGPAPPISAP